MASEVEYVYVGDYVDGLPDNAETPAVDDRTVIFNSEDGFRKTKSNANALTDEASESDLNASSVIEIWTTEGKKKLSGEAIAPRSGSTTEIRNLPDKSEGYLALNDTDGTGKFDIEKILNNFAGEFIQNSTTTVAGRTYMYNGSLYVAKEAYQGSWNASKFESISESEIVERLKTYIVDSNKSLNSHYVKTFSASTTGGYNYPFYVQKGLKYKLKNTSASGQMTAKTLNFGGGDEQQITNTGLNSNTSVEFVASEDAFLVHCYWNVDNGSCTLECLDGIYEKNEVRFSDAEERIEKNTNSISSEFDITKSYEPGEECLIDNSLMKFITKHSAGAYVAGEAKNIDLAHEADGLSEVGYCIVVGSLDVGDTVSFVPSRQISTPYDLRYGVFSTEGVNYIKFTDAFGGDDPRLWCFVDAENKVIAHEPQPASMSDSYTKMVIVPDAAKYVIISIRRGSFEFVNADEIVCDKAFVNVNLSGKMAYESTAHNSYNTLVKKVKAGESFIVNVTTGGGVNAQGWAFADDEFNVISSAGTAVTITDKLVFAPEGAEFLVVSSTSEITGNVYAVNNEKHEGFVKLSSPVKTKNGWESAVGNTVNPNTMVASTASVLHAAYLVEGYTHAVCIGRGGNDLRLWAFLDDNGEVIESAGPREKRGLSVIAIPAGAKTLLFQSVEWGFCYLLKSAVIPNEVFAELAECQDGVVSSVMANVDASGFLKDILFPANLVNSKECLIVRLDCEFASGTPSLSYVVDEVQSKFKLSRTGQRCKYSFRVPPASVTGYVQLSLAVDGTFFKLYGISLSYGGVQNSEVSGIRYDAHLGLSAFAPENTNMAYALASQCGFHGCICNPIKSADGTFYCYHEDTASLTSDGTTPVSLSGAQFHAKTDAELANYKVFGVSTWMRKAYLERIPTLQEFLEICADTGMRPVFSTHPALSAEEFAEVKAMCDKSGLTEKLTIKAFDLSILETAYSVFGKIDRYVADYVSIDDVDEEIAAVKACSFYTPGQKVGMELAFGYLTQEIASAILSEGFVLGTYSVDRGLDDPDLRVDNIKIALGYGVTFFTEDGWFSNAGMLWR